MKIRTVFCASLLLVIILFSAYWISLNQGTTLNLLVATVHVPAAVLISVLAGGILLGARLRAELDALESSRLSTLHELIEHESARIRTQLQQLQQTDSERGDTGSAVIRLH